ncbi:MAG: PEGA domain-containing protein, partial [Kofleriaceae bacterium]
KGKNAYMSPEQILGKPLDRRSDVFALAIVMYEMLAIKRLFHRDSDFLTFKAITEEPIPEIRERRPDLPPGMRAALMQAMARDPNGRFDSAQAFGNAIRNSVSTIGGPATPADLSRLLFTDFGDEMSARDEILKAADDPANNSSIQPPAASPRAITKAPTRPPPIPQRSGELGEPFPRHEDSGLIKAVPSMIVNQPGSSRIEMPAVLDLSTNVPPDTWMANPDTDLLKAHRFKSVMMLLFVILGLGMLAFVAVFMTQFGGCEKEEVVVAPVRPDATERTVAMDAAPEIDAGQKRDDIIALSRFGFFSITATSKTTIYIDGQRIGDTPLTRLPVQPGPHKVKAIGPRGKSKQFNITIYGGRDTESDPISW